MSAAAIQGDYTDIRFIKSRKVAVVSVEIAIEQADAFIRAFGTPRPAEGVPVALARLGAAEEAPTPEKVKREFDTLPLPQQAALLGDREVFVSFLRKQMDVHEDPAFAIRNICLVHSRSDIKPGTPAGDRFIKLRDDFNTWMRTVS